MQQIVAGSEDLEEFVRPSVLLEPTRDEQLAMHALLRDVPRAIVERTLSPCPTIDLQPGQHLIQRGDRREELYLVLHGRLRVTVGGMTLAAIPAGQTVGELALLEPQAACADVVAEAPTRVLVVEAERFWMLVDASHAVAVNMLRALAARIRESTFQVGTVEAQRRAMEALSRTDALTGLANRRWLDETLPRLVARAEHDRAPLSVVALDVDHFKKVNDTWGHATGDRVLVALAEVVRAVVRPTDFAARIGGEELLVVLPATPLEGARVVAERVRRAVRSVSVTDDRGEPTKTITLSAGVATFSLGETAESLVSRADARLYDAKHNGRDRIEG
ncbi:MAG: GGDEF domain-containing protein [Deltaproteobacteria bacterium]|nr:GGDEF domain-containing protein [Deltaproteobacteria bacterium]